MDKLGYAIILCLAYAAMSWAQNCAWPNEPAGSIILSDHGFDSVGGNGWQPVFPKGGEIVDDPSAPCSPPKVMKYTRMPNSIGNTSASSFGLPLTNAMYFGFWWKPSNPFVGWSHLMNKVAFLFSQTGGQFIVYMYGGTRGGPYLIGVQLEYPAMVNSDIGAGWGDQVGSWNAYPGIGPNVKLGEWNRIEVYAKIGTTPTSNNGVLKWWLNGSLVGNFSNIDFPSGFNRFQFTPSWDSPDPTQATPDYYWYDQAHVSLPPGALKPLSLVTTQFPVAGTGKSYVMALKADGGLIPYKWSITSGSLPPGLTFYPTTGFVSGTPTQPGQYSFTIRVADSKPVSETASRSFTLIATGVGGIEKAVFSADKEGTRAMIPGSLSQVVLPGFSAGRNIEMRIYSLAGREVWKQTSGSVTTGPLMQWGNGTYVISAKQGIRNYSTKVLVTR